MKNSCNGFLSGGEGFSSDNPIMIMACGSNVFGRLSMLFATMDFLPTVLYDLITNTVYASVFGTPVIVAILLGAPFAVLHEGANFLIFGVLSVPTITALRKVVKK